MSWHSDKVNSNNSHGKSSATPKPEKTAPLDHERSQKKQEKICDTIDCMGESSEFHENLDALRQIPYFSKLPLEKLKLWAYLTYRNHFRQGEYLFRQGDDDGCAFYLIKGRAVLTHDDGNGAVDIRIYPSETFLGSLTILGNEPRLYSLKAMDDVDALVTEREKVKRLLEHFPELYLPIIQGSIDKIYNWERCFLNHHVKDCKDCASYLGVSVL